MRILLYDVAILSCIFSSFLSQGLAGDRRWAQCAGRIYKGDTTCPPNWTCQYQNPYYSQCLESTGIDHSSSVIRPSDNKNKSSLSQRPAEFFKANKPIEDSSTQSHLPSLQATEESSRPISPLFQSFQEIGSDVSSSDTLAADRASAIAGVASQTNRAAAAIKTGDTVVTDGSLPTSNNAGPASGSIATITWYDSGEGPGACGCAGRWQSPNYGSVMTAAGSNAIYGSQYCGVGCGKCFKLTNTGYTPCKGCPTPPCPELGCNVTASDKAGQFVIVMVTNECPPGGNGQWCGQPKNDYGLAAHFDMAADNSDPVVSRFGPNKWGNAYVNYEPFDCNQAASVPGNRMQTTLTDDYPQSCKCAAQRPIIAGVGGTSSTSKRDRHRNILNKRLPVGYLKN